jgi:3-oxoadipate enol-lactonase
MEHIVDVGGRRLRYLEAGHGDPLLLVHAFPLSAEMWRPQLDAVPEGWRFIAPDLPGFGGSARRGGGAPSMDGYAADVLALVDRLGLSRVSIAGLSMGGYVAFGLLRAARERVRALVLADTRAEADSDEARANREKLLAVLDEQGPRGVADAMVPKLLAPDASPALAAHVRQLVEANEPGGIRDAILALRDRPDSTSLLARCACPALVLAGDADQVTPLALHETMHRALPQSRLAVVAGAGHLSNLERAEAFNTALFGFLLSLPPE